MVSGPLVSHAARLRLLGALFANAIDPGAVPPGQWGALAELALQQGMGPLLLWQVQQAGGALPDDVEQTLREARARISVQSMLARRVQARIQTALHAANIPCLWLKGIALAATVYPGMELRPMVDVDLLVPYAQRAAALAAVQGLGYGLLPQLFDGTEALKHHYALQGPDEDKLLVELHFRLLGAADRLLPLAQLEWFWAHTMPYGKSGLVTLRPEAHLLYLAAHALLQHGEADMRLLRYYDLHRLVTTTPDFDWELMAAGAARLGWTYVAARSLELAQHYFATPLPEGLLATLEARRPRHDTHAHVRRRSQKRTLSEQVVADLATMGWGDRLRSAQRILLPPPAYMRWRYDLATTWQLPGAYWTRWRRMAVDGWQTLRRKAVRHG